MNNNFISALKGDPHDGIPVWFMRQAGRYSRSYQEIRKGMGIKEICLDPEASVRVTGAPVDELGVDGAILFFDILLPAEGMGFRVDFQEGKGPVVENPILSDGAYSPISSFDRKEMPYPVEKTIRVFKENRPDVPLIGFSGGPLTMLSYLIRGVPDRDLLNTKKFMISDQPMADQILDELTETVIMNLKIQIDSGCDAIQVFDSWAGYLSPTMLERYISRFVSDISSEISGKVPSIYFSTQSSSSAAILEKGGFDFLSLDWRCSLEKAASCIGKETGLQGNLDPALAAYSRDQAIMESERIARSMAGKDNFVFNLGHGVLPDTPQENLKAIVSSLHSMVIR